MSAQDTRMDYAARFPGTPGYGAICVDDPEFKEDTARTVAEWIERGATVEHVPVDMACAGLQEYMREADRRKSAQLQLI